MDLELLTTTICVPSRTIRPLCFAELAARIGMAAHSSAFFPTPGRPRPDHSTLDLMLRRVRASLVAANCCCHKSGGHSTVGFGLRIETGA